MFQRPSPALLLRSEAGVLVSGGDVVAGYPNGKLIALDIEDGKLTWEVTVSSPRTAGPKERLALRYRRMSFDDSEEQLRRARVRVPEAEFVYGDLTTIEDPAALQQIRDLLA